jgi:spore germination protein YaaH
MQQSDTVFGWSDVYRNPYIIYSTENGDRIFLWYEDSRSVAEKLDLARLFGVAGASVWRLGIIPNYKEWDVTGCFSKS